ncbi:glycosyltransferase [Sinomicrobium pectinilyticum]|uniref:Glycosyltransferase n=1 Tax=Sinomicrobium pectinilyticum TaxID=1084421 RepID=A0A3N0EH81_SINP1|nr:glycosyltransferase [Sinomicrobium pectinilyticum]RNL87236.1 glycosyltransferase [Sinomicrobium pectinilyticum]
MEDRTFKILMTTDTLGGVWNYSLELCRELQRYDIQVHLASMGAYPTKTQEKEASDIRNVVFYKSDYKLEWMENPWEDIRKVTKWITAIFQTARPDIVHLNNYAQIVHYWDCPIITVYHSCVHTWWQAVKGTTAPHAWDSYKELVKTSLNASDVVISPTRSLLEKATEIHDITSKTKVIYNGRDISFPETPKKEPFILCTGRIWDEAKNLKVLSGLADKITWPIYVAGDNVNPGTGTETRLDNVNILGKLSSAELADWMQRASIYLNPAKYEPFGLAVLEAAAAGCALALSDISTLRELWGNSAAYFSADDPEEMEKTVKTLIHNTTYRKQLAEASGQRAKTYNTRKMGHEYINLYYQLLSDKKTVLTH